MSNAGEPASRHHLRVSDADREQAAEVLRKAAGDGRITFDELDERVSAAYGQDLRRPGPGYRRPAGAGQGAAVRGRPGGGHLPGRPDRR